MKHDDKRTIRAERGVRFFVAGRGGQAKEDDEMMDGLQVLEARERGGRPAIALDVAKYEHLLEDTELSEAQKQEFLEALWEIVVAFVDLGFGVHPVQQACGQLHDFASTAAEFGGDVLELRDHAKQQFEDAAGAAEEDESDEGSP